jgi:AcrR family transcriptional regulator
MDQRAEAAQQTRQRIVQACFDLHGEQGIAGTTMTQIARRAGVSVGTVYHHFPSYEDAVAACGDLTRTVVPPPTDAVFEGVRTLEDRVAVLVQATFDYFDRLGDFALVRADRHRFETVEVFAREEAARRLALTRAALRSFKVPPRQLRVCAAMMDVAVYDELRAGGLKTEEAARDVANMICAGLKARRAGKSPRAQTAPRQTKDQPK